MNVGKHNELTGKLWEIANHRRGPFRPSQYRLVMLSIIMLHRFDCVLERTKDKVLAEHKRFVAAGTLEAAMEKLLARAADPTRKQPLYNVSPYTFQRLLHDQEHIAPNLTTYINGFLENVRTIFERFKFTDQIEKLDASNRLYAIVKAVAEVDLHPSVVDNLNMGYLFEELVRRFNEQANEEVGDHFTSREVIRLMANLIYTGESDVYTSGIYRTIYDPACGTGGMLSVSEAHIIGQNADVNLVLFGQEYNGESWVICCADMLIKDEDTANLIQGDTLGDGKTSDGHLDKRFHYMLANPPFSVEWKDQKTAVEKNYKELGFSGRFGVDLPSINGGSLLFLLSGDTAPPGLSRAKAYQALCPLPPPSPQTLLTREECSRMPGCTI